MLPKFIRKIIGTDGVSQFARFSSQLEEIDLSHVESSTDFHRLVDPIQKDVNYLFDDAEQEDVSRQLLAVYTRLYKKFSRDNKISYGEYKVMDYLYELLEKFTENFTRFISSVDKEDVENKKAKICSVFANIDKLFHDEMGGITHAGNGMISEPPPSAVDKREPFCPNCGKELEAIPDRAKKCPHCKKKIYTYAKEISPGNWERHLTSEEEGNAYYKAIEEEKQKWEDEHSSAGYINSEIDEIESRGFKRVTIQGSGCDSCRDIMGTSVSIADARKMAGKKLSDQCDCPYFFRPDLSSR